MNNTDKRKIEQRKIEQRRRRFFEEDVRAFESKTRRGELKSPKPNSPLLESREEYGEKFKEEF